MSIHPSHIRVAGQLYRLADDLQTEERIVLLASDIHSDFSALALFFKHEQKPKMYDVLIKASRFFNKLSLAPLKKPSAPPPVPKSAQAMTVQQAQETIKDISVNVAKLKELFNDIGIVQYNSGLQSVLQMLQKIQIPQKTTASVLPEFIRVNGRVFRRSY